MLPYKNLLAIDKSSRLAVFKQIALQLIRLIQEGKLLPGTELPSTRVLAADLALHRKTIMAAYDYLVSENWLDSLPRKGFIVSPQLPVVKPRSYHNQRQGGYSTDPGFSYEQFTGFSYTPPPSRSSEIVVDDGFPDIRLLPAEAMLKEYRRALEYPMLQKISSGWELEGSGDFRTALCDFLNQTRGLDIRKEHLLTTRGAQMAIYVAAALIIRPGDKVIVGEPSYFFANMIFENLGATLIRVPVDDQGMCTDKIEEILETQSVKLLYVIPHHHHPTTVTMSVERRNHLLLLIRNYNLAVIEDDYDYDFQFQSDPYLPLASGHHAGNIIYIGSLTKVLGTPFRLGYIVAAEKFIHAAAQKRILIDLRGDVFSEQVVSGLIEHGELSRLIQKANKLYCQRCDFLSHLLRAELSDVLEFKKPDGGMALWLRFKPEAQLEQIVTRVASRGLKFTGTVLYPSTDNPIHALRFGFASLSETQLEQAVGILKASLNK